MKRFIFLKIIPFLSLLLLFYYVSKSEKLPRLFNTSMLKVALYREKHSWEILIP